MLFGQVHIGLPRGIDQLELLTLQGQLLGNIGRIEDGLQVHPLSLALHPLLHDVGHCFQLGVPADNLLLEGLLEGAELDGLGVHEVLVQHDLDLIVASNDVGDVLVRDQVEAYVLPGLPHCLEHHLDVVLLAGTFAHVHAQIHILDQSHIETLLEVEPIDCGIHREPNPIGYGFPMPIFHALLPQRDH